LPNTAVLVDEQTESYGVDSNRVNIVLHALKEQLRKKSIHFFFCSPTLKDEYHCLAENTILSAKNKGYVELKDVVVGDTVLDAGGKFAKVKNKWIQKRDCLKIKTDFGGEVIASKEHRFLLDRGIDRMKNIKLGEFIKLSKPILRKGSESDYYKGFFYGAFLADGYINGSQRYVISKYTGLKVRGGRGYTLRISNNDILLKKELMRIGRKFFKFKNAKIHCLNKFEKKKRAEWVEFYGKEPVLAIEKLLGNNIKNKKMPCIETIEQAKGILDGFASCDSGWSVQKTKLGVEKLQVSFNVSSGSIAHGLCDILHCFGIFPVIRKYSAKKRKRKKINKKLDFIILFIPSLQVADFFKVLHIRNGTKAKSLGRIRHILLKKNFLPGNYKRIDKFGFCKVISIEPIGELDCIDIEVDSKDHLFQINNGIISHNTSQYVLETMFIDYEEKITYCAYKTRELLTLGYVKIPHPLNFLPREFLEEYEARKDAHLDMLTGVKQVDEIEDRAKLIMASPIFLKAELIYRKKLGYVPMNMLWQIISKLYPDFKSGVMVGELASRIKLNKELTGEWMISGVKPKKK
jgi:hypothetical protein